MMEDFGTVWICVYGFSLHSEFVLVAGAKIKTVTSNLPLLSVSGADHV
jgi:hypothetical protein